MFSVLFDWVSIVFAKKNGQIYFSVCKGATQAERRPTKTTVAVSAAKRFISKGKHFGLRIQQNTSMFVVVVWKKCETADYFS